MKKINSERKILFQFIAVLIVSGLIGGLTEYFLQTMKNGLFILPLNFAANGRSLSIFDDCDRHCRIAQQFSDLSDSTKKSESEWDQENEEYIDQVERQIERGIIITEIIQIFIFLFLGFLFLNLKDKKNAVAGLSGCLHLFSYFR